MPESKRRGILSSILENLPDILAAGAEGYAQGAGGENLPSAAGARGFSTGYQSGKGIQEARKRDQENERKKAMINQIRMAPASQRAELARNFAYEFDPEAGVMDDFSKASASERTAEENRRRGEDFANREKLLKLSLDAKAKQQAEKASKGRPVPVSAAEKTAQIDVLRGLLDEVRNDYDSSFVGPLQARAGRVSQVTGLGASEKRGRFLQNLASVRNQILQLRSGAAITPQEASRLLQELPDPNRSDVDFSVAMSNFDNSLRRIQEARAKALKDAGYNIEEREDMTQEKPEDFSDINQFLER